MHRVLFWLASVTLGVIATLMSSFGLVFFLAFFAVAFVLVLQGDRLVGVSGLLTGFGAFWTFLITRQTAGGGTLDDEPFWLLMGAAPLAIGVLLLLVRVGQRARLGRGTARRRP